MKNSCEKLPCNFYVFALQRAMKTTNLFEFLKIDKYCGVFLESCAVMKNENYGLDLLHTKETTVSVVFFRC